MTAKNTAEIVARSGVCAYRLVVGEIVMVFFTPCRVGSC